MEISVDSRLSFCLSPFVRASLSRFPVVPFALVVPLVLVFEGDSSRSTALLLLPKPAESQWK